MHLLEAVRFGSGCRCRLLILILRGRCRILIPALRLISALRLGIPLLISTVLIPTVLVPSSLLILPGRKKLDFRGHDFLRYAGGAVVGLIGSGTDRPDHQDFPPLRKVTLAILSQLIPGAYPEKIRFRLRIVVCSPAIYGNGEVAYILTSLRCMHLRIASQITDNNQLIDKSFLLALWG